MSSRVLKAGALLALVASSALFDHSVADARRLDSTVVAGRVTSNGRAASRRHDLHRGTRDVDHQRERRPLRARRRACRPARSRDAARATDRLPAMAACSRPRGRHRSRGHRARSVADDARGSGGANAPQERRDAQRAAADSRRDSHRRDGDGRWPPRRPRWPRRVLGCDGSPCRRGSVVRTEPWQHRGVRPHRRESLPRRRAQPALDLLRRRRPRVVHQRPPLPQRRARSRPKDAVRIEELVNYFPYGDPRPDGRRPLRASRPRSPPRPWNPEHQLVRVGAHAHARSTCDELPPGNLVFLIDVSGSMERPNRLPLVKQSLALLVDELREQDRVAIVVYAGAAGWCCRPRPAASKQRILAALEGLEAGGSTAGGAGIRLAYDVARENFIRGGNNRVILCTDGDFNVGASSDGELVASSSSSASRGRSSPSSASAWATSRTRRWRSSPTTATATTPTSTTCSRRARCS